MDKPICYTFRRCPYAIRARMTLDYSAIETEYREILFRNKPPAMLEASPKGTVPVLIGRDGTVLEQSRDIMNWCLTQYDPDNWQPQSQERMINRLIDQNDNEFKYWLDRYKYADRYPQFNEAYYRSKAEVFVAELEDRLSAHRYLVSDQLSLADIALFPFVRQFSMVDAKWFEASEYVSLKRWLGGLLTSERFARVMIKRPVWAF